MNSLRLTLERVYDGVSLCFRHAVLQAQAGVDITILVEEDSSGGLDQVRQHCETCAKDENKLTGTIAAFEAGVARVGAVMAASKGPTGEQAPVAEGVREFCEQMDQGRAKQADSVVEEIVSQHAAVQAALAYTQHALHRVFGALGTKVSTPAGMSFAKWLVAGGTDRMLERIKILREGKPLAERDTPPEATSREFADYLQREIDVREQDESKVPTSDLLWPILVRGPSDGTPDTSFWFSAQALSTLKGPPAPSLPMSDFKRNVRASRNPDGLGPVVLVAAWVLSTGTVTCDWIQCPPEEGE